MRQQIVCIIIFFSFCPTPTSAQNLVPNSSFEELINLPVKRNPKNSFEFEPNSGFIPFQRNLKYWFAGSKTTPDLRISNKLKYLECKKTYDDCDKAKTGNMSVGIITYMKNFDTNTYREYIQVMLKEPLKAGIKTYAQIWVAKERQAKLTTNNIGLYFSKKKIYGDVENRLDLKPQINFDTLINQGRKGWTKLLASFVPEEAFKFLTIGNFYENEKTIVAEYEDYSGSPYTPPYAYYLIDDVRIWQEGELPEKPVFAGNVVESNKPIQLNNINFKFDSAELIENSYLELEKLFVFLTENPKLKIAIHGHTDKLGSESYNLKLSEARAQTVYFYLLDKGIDKGRIQYEGFGESNSLMENSTEEGRAVNRRVEFVVLHY